jgi:hypothetical protein
MPPISSFFDRLLVQNNFFLFAGTFYLMKKSAKVLRNSYSAPVWKTPNRPQNIKCIVLAVFRDRFVEKDGGLRTHNPSAEGIRELEIFLY